MIDPQEKPIPYLRLLALFTLTEHDRQLILPKAKALQL